MSVAVVSQRRAAPDLRLLLVAITAFWALAGFALRFAAFRLALPELPPDDFFRAICKWDCNWYVTLAETGYDRFPTPKQINAGNWAFFPLYPMLIGVLRMATQLPTLPLAALVGTGLSAATALLAWPLLGRDLRAFTLFSAFLLCGPFSVYFTSFFTETLFACLTIAVFSALEARRFLLAGMLAALLSATRIVGVFIVFAILWEVWRDHRERGGTWRDFLPAIFGRPTILLTFAVAPLGLFAYMAFLHVWIGDGLAFQHVQRAWGRPSGLPPVFIWNGLTTLPQQGFWPTASQWLAGAACLGYCGTLLLFLTRRTAMGIFALIALTLPLFAGLASMTRFIAGMAPLWLLPAIFAGRSRTGFALVLALLLVAGFFTTQAWFDGALALV